MIWLVTLGSKSEVSLDMEVLNGEIRHKREEAKKNNIDERPTGWMNLGILGSCICFSRKAEQHHGDGKPRGHHGILVLTKNLYVMFTGLCVSVTAFL